MEIIGLICEYNPFHNGHIYHIEKIKELYPNSLLILVLNGYFLERGEMSILSKEAKTKIALNHGIDIVLELPTLYGTQSADTFAKAALTLLDAFHVQKIVFGSELNDIEKLKEIVNKIETDKYQEKVKELLKKGINYPTALAKAIDTPTNFNHPNDLLAISYIKAIYKNDLKIEPISIKRTNAYHDIFSTDAIVSASNIRTKLEKKEDITNYLPLDSLENILTPNYNKLFELLKFKILTTPHLENFLTIEEGIENRLKKEIKNCNTYQEFIERIKTKRYTYNKLNRMCIHILLGITKEQNKNATLSYCKILGFNKKGQEFLKHQKENVKIPTIVDKNSIQCQIEITASLVYDLIMSTNTYNYEKKNQPTKF